MMACSQETRYCRFGSNADQQLVESFNPPGIKRFGLIASDYPISIQANKFSDLMFTSNQSYDVIAVVECIENELAISVNDDYQKQGIGSKLFAHAIAHFKSTGINQIHVQCLTHNHSIKKLVKKFDGTYVIQGSECIGQLTLV
jgi:GNAT superfamily N-acetyltransferase